MERSGTERSGTERSGTEWSGIITQPGVLLFII